mgnify:CR=1 FL=1
MARTNLKVYDAKEHIASCKYAVHAILLCRFDTCTIRYGHEKIIWRHGKDWLPGMSIAQAVDILNQRIAAVKSGA